MAVSFSDIEDGVVALLTAAGLPAIEADLPSVLQCKVNASFHCRVTGFKAEVFAMRKQKIVPVVSVFVAVKNVSAEKVRRQAIYPLLHGIIGALVFQKLGLAISPIMCTSGDELGDPVMDTTGMRVYQINFKTSFVCEMTAEEALNMIALSVQYFLTPGDAVADAQDDIYQFPAAPEEPGEPEGGA